ncbi:hypothetical protein CSKR_110388 [Clonorchis sinensis]|uniref:Uncharacterized protein n=2 Tax=Clonorchis sinensis TaxID=79923 RepID=A0A8T1M2T7_CLOSI|nr:hypothetical protein CSKR_110388 [Clonorchis sinensis]GAA28375.2 protein tiptop [Clonorchis sinensis]
MEVLPAAAPKVTTKTNSTALEFSLNENTATSTMGLEASNPISPLTTASVSPECQKTPNLTTRTPQYPSPPILPPLNLSSLPNTPTSGPSTDLSPLSKRPSSAEILRSPGERQVCGSGALQITQLEPGESAVKEAEEVHVESDIYQHGSTNAQKSIASVSKVTEPREDGAISDWTQALQQLAAFCYGSKKPPDDCQRSCDVSLASQFLPEPMNTFQAMLANMGQLLLSSQFPNPSSKVSKGGSHDTNPQDSPSHNSVRQYESPNPLQMPNFPPAPPLPTSFVNGTEHSTSAFKSQNTDLSNPQSSLALTASLLAMMAVQKPDGHGVHSNSFLTSSVIPNTSCSSTLSSTMPPSLQSLFASNSTQSLFNTADSASTKHPGPNLTDGRDLLYQLGQHLMAMATCSTSVDCIPKSSNEMGSASTSGASNSGLGFPSAQLPFLSDSVSSFINTKMFPSPAALQAQGHMPFQDVPSSTSQDRRTSNFGVPLQSMGFDKNLPHLSTSGTGLSGISMRGNQKYSAYYQHQRKQGFSLGVTGDFNNPNQSRRQATTNPLSNPRYGGRRFRSGFGGATPSMVGLDARGLQRLPGVRGPSNAVGGSIYPNFRGGSYKHSLTSPGLIPGHMKSHGTVESMNPLATAGAAVTSSAADHASTPTRLRDTAFLCSCGKDFESLYVFTLHMKDTGHKPKSDQSERDIPKLVRGQDMWINSETEQTREILRCMRCHQSFRNLPELTMHMMKTNHYSEIVYNDSGRLVFVNPDEPRRGSGTSSGSTSIHMSPSKLPVCNLTGKRSSRTSTSGHTSITGSTWSNGLQSPDSADSSSTLDRQENPTSAAENNRELIKHRDSGEHDSSDPKQCQPWRTLKQGKIRKTETNKPESVETSVHKHLDDVGAPSTSCQSPTRECSISPEPPDLKKAAGSPSSTTSIKATVPEISDCSVELQSQKFETSVLRQIESFVQNSLQGNARSLSVKVENCSSNASQLSSPHSVSTEFGPNVSLPNSSASQLSPAARKRTHSEANLSGHCSPVSSLTDELDVKLKHTPSTSPDKRVSMTSPISTTVTSSSDSSHLSENPLSSLQKLVDTTHKPVHPTAAFSASTSSTLFVSCSSTTHSSKPPTALRSPSGSASSNVRTPYTTSGKTPLSSVLNNASSFTQLVSPSSENDNITPALSALYAYVEKSSPCQPRELHSDFAHNKESLGRTLPFPGGPCADNRSSPHVVNSPDKAMNPALQALYAAAMSTVAAQYLNSASPNNMRLSTLPDPLNLFKQAASNLKKAFESSTGSSSPSKTEPTNTWVKMLQMLSGFQNGPSWNEQTYSETPEPPEVSSPTHISSLSPRQSSSTPSGENRIGVDFLPGGNDSRNNSPGPNTGRATKVDPPSCKSPPSMSGLGVQTSGFRSNVPNPPSSRYPPPTLSVRPLGATNGPGNLMSTMITKKAKCHFCGKPFANKGQVRLHISKNKCPCLLQQSCHVAALAAAFGSDSRVLANNPSASVPHSQTPGKPIVSSPLNADSTPLSTGLPFTNFPTPHRSPSTKDSIEVPSALSLLKERFQNFDLMHQRQNNGSSSGPGISDANLNTSPFLSAFTSLPHGASETDRLFSNQFFPPISHKAGQWNNGNAMTNPVPSSKLPASYPGVGGLGSTTAAANANHLAAMALLAQTLAQITSSQLARPPTSENTTDTTTNLPNPVSLNLSPSMIDPRNPFHFMNPANFNLDLLLNQVNFAKQLNHFNWNEQSLDGNLTNSTNMSAGH